MKKSKLILIIICCVVITLLAIILVKTIGGTTTTTDLNHDVTGDGVNQTVIRDDSGNITSINITEDLKIALRNIIPHVYGCEDYLYKQYNGDYFTLGYMTAEDYTENYNNCTTNIKVFHTQKSIENNTNEVYIYDYVLLYNGTNYGKDINNMNIPVSKVKLDNNGVPTDDTIKKNGAVYKYTFMNNNVYRYVSTEYVK